MTTEQREYIRRLLQQTPDKVLANAYEHTDREKILKTLTFVSLTTEQTEALLDSPMPLNNVFQNYHNWSKERVDDVQTLLSAPANQIRKKIS